MAAPAKRGSDDDRRGSIGGTKTGTTTDATTDAIDFIVGIVAVDVDVGGTLVVAVGAIIVVVDVVFAANVAVLEVEDEDDGRGKIVPGTLVVIVAAVIIPMVSSVGRGRFLRPIVV